MKFLELSNRLKTVTGYLPYNSRVADIGSDHAYLLLYLAQHQKLQFGIAGEINEGPFLIAKNNINHSKFEGLIQARHGDGLDVIDINDNIQHITICGMGGVLIREILKNGLNNPAFPNITQFILQPNSGEKELRQWLSLNNFTIDNEKIIEDSKKLYEIIVVKYNSGNNSTLNYKEIMFGPCLLNQKDLLFQKKWNSELQHKKNVVSSIKQSKTSKIDKVLQLNYEIAMIEEVLA